MLKVGRHFRLDPRTKAVVGRNQDENARLEELARDGDVLIMLADVPGPTTLLRGDATLENTLAAAALTARSSKARAAPVARVWARRKPADSQTIVEVTPADDEFASAVAIGGVEHKGHK